ncbi:unnamed protein product [Brachionus calyciflorus]|uniref:Apolipoprotein D n=1 Tax=Brachionus calyciflorus TaxID=104777 RepID=A0A813S5B9_9BILA|nr:unnamed protein product [Brachionus calyciflorus]
MRLILLLALFAIFKYSQSISLSDILKDLRDKIEELKKSQACPESPLIPNFDLKAYLGKWYEIERITPIYEQGLKCVTAEYADKGNGIVSVKNSGVLPFNLPLSINGEARVKNASAPNFLTVQFFKDLNTDLFQGNYHVWKTDYTKYALVYTCKTKSTETAWILSRNKTLDSTTVAELKQFLNNRGVNSKKLTAVTQNCKN